MPSRQSTLTSNGPAVEDDSPTKTTTPGNSSSTTLPGEEEESSNESAANSPRGPPSDIDEDQIATLDASTEVEEWTSSCEAGGLDYAYLHIKVDVYRTLTDTWWGLHVITQEKIIDNTVNSYGGYVGHRQPSPDTLIETITSWVASTLSAPYISRDNHHLPIGHHLRSVPVDRVRIFVSDDAINFLDGRGITLDSVVGVTQDIPEYSASTDYRDRVEAYYESRETIKQVRSRIGRLEKAVGAAFGIATGFGGGIPSSPPEEFEDYSPNELQEELEATRKSRREAESRRDKLKEELDSIQESYLAEIASELSNQVS